MQTDLARLDIGSRRRSLIGYAGGMALYTLVVVALYPAFKNSTSLDTLVHNDATAAALFGITGRISTSAGWLNANIYANFLPLIMLLLTVGYGAAAIAGQHEDGTLCLLATLPVRRATLAIDKAAAMAGQTAILAVVVGVCVMLGRSFQLRVSFSDVVATTAATALMAVDFGLITLAVGARTGSRGTALGVGAGLAAGSYLISSLAPVAGWIRPERYVSLFYWSVANSQITDGVSIADYGVLVLVAVAALYLAVNAFGKLDIR